MNFLSSWISLQSLQSARYVPCTTVQSPSFPCGLYWRLWNKKISVKQSLSFFRFRFPLGHLHRSIILFYFSVAQYQNLSEMGFLGFFSSFSLFFCWLIGPWEKGGKKPPPTATAAAASSWERSRWNSREEEKRFFFGLKATTTTTRKKYRARVSIASLRSLTYINIHFNTFRTAIHYARRNTTTTHSQTRVKNEKKKKLILTHTLTLEEEREPREPRERGLKCWNSHPSCGCGRLLVVCRSCASRDNVSTMADRRLKKENLSLTHSTIGPEN